MSYRILYFVPHVLNLIFIVILGIWWVYIRIEPGLQSYADQKIAEPLWEAVRDENYSWWQRRELIRMASGISCSEENQDVNLIAESGRTEYKTALYQGCFTREYEHAGFLVPVALKDMGLSYHRFMALRYLRKQGQLSSYIAEITKMQTDSSQMVRYEVQDILKFMQQEARAVRKE